MFSVLLSVDNNCNQGHIIIDGFVFSHGRLIFGQPTMCTMMVMPLSHGPGTLLYTHSLDP